jgi:hypothetical protein
LESERHTVSTSAGNRSCALACDSTPACTPAASATWNGPDLLAIGPSDLTYQTNSSWAASCTRSSSRRRREAFPTAPSSSTWTTRTTRRRRDDRAQVDAVTKTPTAFLRSTSRDPVAMEPVNVFSDVIVIDSDDEGGENVITPRKRSKNAAHVGATRDTPAPQKRPPRQRPGRIGDLTGPVLQAQASSTANWYASLPDTHTLRRRKAVLRWYVQPSCVSCDSAPCVCHAA